MSTFHLRHNHFGHLHPFPFNSREGAERFRTQLGAEDRYTIFELVHKVETEEEREERLDREFENEVVENFVATGNQDIQL